MGMGMFYLVVKARDRVKSSHLHAHAPAYPLNNMTQKKQWGLER